ncbi:transglycosylase family protein, partial [Kitasatospora sp. MBT66]|uniref:transglycosylase family protein n=1 Tax=Kitasatospora sp. MBT66 TaxID=1444769 RepID=UPI0026F4653B
MSTWDKVAQCESTGNWSINTGGTYYGGLQISLHNWQYYGGTAYAPRPDLATKKQQILIAEKILADQGAGAWSCAPGTGLATDHADPYPSGAGTESGGAGRVRWADFDGDGRADYVILNDNGSVRVFLNKGGDGHGGWNDLGQVSTGMTSDRARVRLADYD